MKGKLLILAVLMPMIAFAQNQKSDDLYNKGVELYNAEHFDEAIKYFMQSDSLEKAGIDPSSPAYYRSELAIAASYANIAVDKYNNGDNDEAIRLENDALEIRRKALGEEHPDYASSLSNLALYTAATGNIDEAIRLENNALKIRINALGKDHPDYAASLCNLADFNSAIGKYSDAIRLGTTAMEIRRTALGEEHPDYAQSLNNLATYNYYLGRYDEAIRLGNVALQIWKTLLGEQHPYYAQSLGNLADYNAKIGNYSTAISLGTKTVEIFKNAFGIRHPYYAQAMGNLASYYYYTGNYKEAIRRETIAMQIKEAVYGNSHLDYAQSLANLAEYNAKTGNYAEAVRLATEAMEIKKTALGEEHPDYAQALSNLAGYNSAMGNYADAIKLGKEATDILKRSLGGNHPDYAKALNNLAGHYAAMGNYAEAAKLGGTATEIIKKAFGAEHPDYATSLDNLANFNLYVGDNTDAIRLGLEALEIRRKALGERHPDFAQSLNNVAAFNAAVNNYNEAIKLETAAMEIRKRILGESHPDYAQSVSNLASFNSAIGNYAEAVRLGTLAMEIRKKVLGDDHPLYASSLNNLGDYNYKMGNKDEAIRLVTLAMEIEKKRLGEDHPDYASALSNLAVYNSEVGNFQDAVKYEKSAMEIKKRILGESHPDYASSLSNLAVYYSNLGNYAEAVRLENIAIEIKRQNLGEDHPLYATSLNNLASYNLYEGNYEDASKQLSKRYEITNSFILKNFSTMTYKERTNFWNMHSNFFSATLPFAAYKNNCAMQNVLAYNGQLFSKGLILNAELEIQNLIEKSGDQAFADRYNKIRSDRAMLDHLYQMPPAKRTMNADSLAALIEREEKQLVESSKELGDYTRDLAITWHDVQDKMTDEDLAVEFANFFDEDRMVYVAIVLKKGMSAPELLALNMTKVDTTAYYTKSEMYNIVWKPLLKYLKGVKNVYFAPSGIFHSIAIEYLPDDRNKIFAKRYNVYRLTSTREIVLDKTPNPEKKAAVYGGIIYNFSKGDWADLKDYKDEIVAEFRDIPDLTETQRAGIGFLKGAQVEAQEVIGILRDGSYLVSEGSDINATEESFKKLSGTGVKMLHIATHGFYEPANKAKSFSDFLTTGNKNDKEALSLSRSGLFLAGAASALDPVKRKDIPEGVDDGILTAKEISRLDFSGLDLVVLSACQTGLGEVTGEGVFGLQRGFKKAGAQTIVMSLWKVDDAATKDLMTEFYKNLVAGKTKREAFVTAQDLLRDKYKDPKKWAAFIMVDGTERSGTVEN